jgi:hypothetical protein
MQHSMHSASGSKNQSEHRGESLRQIPFSHAAFLRYNGARERSVIQSLISSLIGYH